MNSRKALLVIDMQKGSFTSKTPRYRSHEVISRINQLMETFRANAHPVLIIQHDGLDSGAFTKHTEEWDNLDELIIKSSDILMDKYANDVFYKSDLSQLLHKLNVRDLYITGCATDFCVASTVQSAIAKDYFVTVAADAHTTADRPHLQAEKVIQHYNWVWQNMIPTAGTIKVISTSEILEEIHRHSTLTI